MLSVKGHGKSTVKLTNGRVHDRRKFIVGDRVRGKLPLFDRGYCNFQLFTNILRSGGHFLSRLKENANPTIVRVLDGSAAEDRRFVGKTRQEVLGGLRRERLDAEVEVRARARCCNAKRSSTNQRLRLVAVRNTAQRKYHCHGN